VSGTLDDLTEVLQTIRDEVKTTFDGDRRQRWSIERLGIFAGNRAERHCREEDLDDGVDPWAELIAIRNVYSHYTPQRDQLRARLVGHHRRSRSNRRCRGWSSDLMSTHRVPKLADRRGTVVAPRRLGPSHRYRMRASSPIRWPLRSKAGDYLHGQAMPRSWALHSSSLAVTCPHCRGG